LYLCVAYDPFDDLESAILRRTGDILRMLKLPAGQKAYDLQEVETKQVLVGNALWRPNKEARVLLLGDSFCNIFSLESMGWGESAGFAEQLSRALGGQPLDCILRNSDGSFATREFLSRELARGRDRLVGKKVVVWEFAVRELAFGNWKLLDMKLGRPQITHFLSPGPKEEMVVNGMVEAVSPVPLAGSVPYKDHILTVHLVDINGPSSQNNESFQPLAPKSAPGPGPCGGTGRTLAACYRSPLPLRLKANGPVPQQNPAPLSTIL
jgi:hypothetical protein